MKNAKSPTIVAASKRTYKFRVAHWIKYYPIRPLLYSKIINQNLHYRFDNLMRLAQAGKH